ncbi:unnamed protein product [Mytilus edulis]|uniref:Uncharacterized protein n=1 Tax=Mytilus edulis TaxID=6550 RepID=A0A8S3QZY1_MYTED|nr:unnamed protein product [Mytilus edulis]
MQEELDTSELAPDIKWERYEYVNIKTKGSSRRKLMLISKTTKPGEMFTYFKDILKTFPSHQFRANWQNKQFKMLKENLPQQHCIFVHDFSENYRCFENTEIQSSYFVRLEISIHVTLIYRLAILEIDGEESTIENQSIITEHFFVFSPDESHDTYFTHDVRKLVTNYLSSISAYVTTIHEFTDGCQAQYKSRHCLGDFSYSKEDFGFDQYFRNFFETSHAKGLQDAAGGFVKRQADIAVLRGKVTIKTAEDMYQFSIQNLTKPNESASCKRRILRLLDNTERDELRKFKPVPDNRSIQRVHCVENGIISVKNYPVTHVIRV